MTGQFSGLYSPGQLTNILKFVWVAETSPFNKGTRDMNSVKIISLFAKLFISTIWKQILTSFLLFTPVFPPPLKPKDINT